MEFTREQLEKIISEAPKGAEYYTPGYDVEYSLIDLQKQLDEMKMNNKKLTVKQARDLGVVFAKGDEIRVTHGVMTVGYGIEIDIINSSEYGGYDIAELEWRTNEGVRPCDETMRVEVLINGHTYNGLTKDYLWNHATMVSVSKWKYDLPKLIEMANKMNDSQDMQSVDSESVEPKELLYTQSELDAALHSEILQKKDYLKQLQALEGKLELYGNTEEFKSGDVVNTPLGYGVIVGVSIRNPNFWWVELDDEEYARDIHKSGLSKSLTQKKQLRLMMKNAIKLHDLANANYPAYALNDWDSATIEVKEMWVAVAKEIKFKDEIDS